MIPLLTLLSEPEGMITSRKNIKRSFHLQNILSIDVLSRDRTDVSILMLLHVIEIYSKYWVDDKESP